MQKANTSMGANSGFPATDNSPDRICRTIQKHQQQRGSSLQNEDRPGFGRAKGQRAKQQQAEYAIEDDAVRLRAERTGWYGGVTDGCSHHGQKPSQAEMLHWS